MVLQIFGYDAVTLQCTMSSLTYPAPCTKHLMQGEVCFEGTAVPLALGSRWLAFASNVSCNALLAPRCGTIEDTERMSC
jgi:hypothetical protein